VTGHGRVLHAFDHEVHSVAYSPDGSRIAAADTSGTILVLDADSGQVVDTPEPVSGPYELAFSPDGRLVAGAGHDQEALLWDLETGRVVRRFRGALYRTTSVAFVNGGAELLVASGEGTVRGYVIDPHDLVQIARDKVKRDLTEEECQRYLRAACDR
jgi:WD40 repeat protein